MSVKYFCDGCDQAVGPKREFSVIISSMDIKPGMPGMEVSNYATNAKFYELCEGCERRLRTLANPKEWARGAHA